MDRTAPESGTARSLIQTPAEALMFAESPKPPCRRSNSLRMPAAVPRRSAGVSANLRPSGRPDPESRSPVRGLVWGRRQPVGL